MEISNTTNSYIVEWVDRVVLSVKVRATNMNIV